MIPKTIHYCWFGGNPLPTVAKRCIESWKSNCPDFKIKEWNESNFDVHMNPYTEMCIREKKYAFLSDYARLWIVAKEGGIYLDTDVELLKPLDDLLDCEAYFGFETEQYIASGLGFGAVPGCAAVTEMLKSYDDLLDGLHGTIGCPLLNTAALERLGFAMNGQYQRQNGVCLYPPDYFNPMDNATGVVHSTAHTYSIHRYSMLWLPQRSRVRSRITRVFHLIFGKDCFAWLRK